LSCQLQAIRLEAGPHGRAIRVVFLIIELHTNISNFEIAGNDT
jgi:hypothetical protein